MGSVAPLRRAPDYGTKLLKAIRDRSQERAERSKEPDIVQTKQLLADAIDDPGSRESTLQALAEFLSAALVGCLPDLED